MCATVKESESLVLLFKFPVLNFKIDFKETVYDFFSVQVTTTKYHRVIRLNNRNIFSPNTYEGQEIKIEVLMK